MSVTTVSRVLNNLPNVRPEVRERVLEAVQALHYHPSRTARRLRAKRSSVIGLIIPDIQNPFFTSVARGIEDAAHRRDYSVVLCNSDENADKERLYVEVMCAESVAGVILATTSDGSPSVSLLMDCGIPFAAVDRTIAGADVDTVLVSNTEAVLDAVSHLLDLGHRRIGYISLPLNLTVGSERHTGYWQAYERRGLTVAPELIRIGDAHQASGYRCALELLSLAPPITALFVANNLMTLGALDAIHECGARVPDQLSLIGFDDMPLAAYLQPPLTTVAQPTYQLGQKAAELLFDRIERPDKPVEVVRLKTSLVVRRSTCELNGTAQRTTFAAARHAPPLKEVIAQTGAVYSR